MMIAEARLTEPAKRAAERKRFNILIDIVVVVVVKKERRRYVVDQQEKKVAM